MHTWKHTFEATDFAKTDNGKRRIQRYMQTYIPFMHDSLYTIPLVSKDDYVQFPGGGPRMRWTTLCRRTSLYFFSNSFEHHSLHLGWIHKLFWIVMSIRQQIQTPSKRVRTNPIYLALTPLPFYSGYPRTWFGQFCMCNSSEDIITVLQAGGQSFVQKHSKGWPGFDTNVEFLEWSESKSAWVRRYSPRECRLVIVPKLPSWSSPSPTLPILPSLSRFHISNSCNLQAWWVCRDQTLPTVATSNLGALQWCRACRIVVALHVFSALWCIGLVISGKSKRTQLLWCFGYMAIWTYYDILWYT